MNKSYILITGASSGIGQEIASQLSKANNLILHGRDRQKLKQTLAICDSNYNHLIWEYNLENVNSLENSLSEFISQNNCSITAFIHCAGYLKVLPLKMMKAEYLHLSFTINVSSAAIISKVLNKKKINQDNLKSVVFVSSNISNFAAKGFSAYAASKAALDGLMRCLAIELAPKIRVNSVLPGSIKTGMTEHMYDNQQLINRMENSYPLGLGFPKDIADAIKFLISDEARWITGIQLVIDGGRTINITG